MQTITSALRPYLRHVAATGAAVERPDATDADWRAAQCAHASAMLAATRARGALHAVPAPVYPAPRPRPGSHVSQSTIPVLAKHAVRCAEACSAEMTCNGHAASLRAYHVARHYARVLWPR